MALNSATIEVMKKAARKAARSLARDFGEVENLQVSKKGPADFVSAADTRAEEIILDELRYARPGYGYLLEESGVIEGTDKTHRFIVDPLDGTLNFLHGIPHFAISIALERDGELFAGVVYDLSRDEMFYAESKRGAWVESANYPGDRRLMVSSRQHMNEAVFATGIPFMGKPGHATFLTELHSVMGTSAGVRRFGSAALDLAWVAAGRYDGFWERNLKPWDIAAGIILVREAKGLVEPLEDGSALETGHIIATNGHLMDKLAALVKK